MHPYLSDDSLRETEMYEHNPQQEMVKSDTKRKRKTRRGKKKKNITEHGCCRESETESCAVCRDLMSECEYIHQNLSKKSKRRNRRLLRPRYSPKAPCNYTSFIMDDHIENADGYLSYESPESNFDQKLDDWCFSPDYFTRMGTDSIEICEAENDDMSKALDFMKNDFESTYNASRAEELSKLSKSELIDAISKMEDRAEILTLNLDNVAKTEMQNQNLTMKQNIRSLQKENESLLVENELLKSMLCRRQ